MIDANRCTRATRQGQPCKSRQVSGWYRSEVPDPHSCISHLTADERAEFEKLQAKSRAEGDSMWLAGLFAPKREGSQAPKQEDPHAETARKLAETTANLDAYIERRAQEIAAPRIAAAERAARERIAEVEHEAALARQRWDDLETELRRQVETAWRSYQRLKETTP